MVILGFLMFKGYFAVETGTKCCNLSFLVYTLIYEEKIISLNKKCNDSCGKWDWVHDVFEDPLDLLVVSRFWDMDVVDFTVHGVPVLVAGVLD